MFYRVLRALDSQNPENSRKVLPSVTLRNEVSANCTSTTTFLPSTFCRDFYQVPSDARQIKVIVTTTSDDDGDFAKCVGLALSKEGSSGPHDSFCAESHKLALDNGFLFGEYLSLL
jgi:hypothetical protein